jgi:hypothetical protein
MFAREADARGGDVRGGDVRGGDVRGGDARGGGPAGTSRKRVDRCACQSMHTYPPSSARGARRPVCRDCRGLRRARRGPGAGSRAPTGPGIGPPRHRRQSANTQNFKNRVTRVTPRPGPGARPREPEIPGLAVRGHPVLTRLIGLIRPSEAAWARGLRPGGPPAGPSEGTTGTGTTGTETTDTGTTDTGTTGNWHDRSAFARCGAIGGTGNGRRAGRNPPGCRAAAGAGRPRNP